jgi:hypothetical protein
MPRPASIAPVQVVQHALTPALPIEQTEVLQEEAAKAGEKKSNKKDEKKAKIPRPPNAFILYRQHYHPIIKDASPGIHNNVICMYLHFSPYSHLTHG